MRVNSGFCILCRYFKRLIKREFFITNIYRSALSIGLFIFSSVVSAEDSNTGMAASEASVPEKRLTVPKSMAIGIQHRSYDFASIEKSDAKLAIDSTLVKLPLGKLDFGKSFFVPSLSIEKTAFRFDDVDVDNQEVYTLKTQFLVVTPTHDKWTRIIQLTPSLHSDLDAIDDDAFSLLGLAMWRYQSTELSTWTMGVGFTRLFGEYKPIPLISYQYNVADNIQLDVGFPITKAEYRWQKDWSMYASVRPVGGNWRYESEDGQRLNISYSSWVAATGVRYQFKPKLWAALELGQGFARNLNLNADDRSNEEVDISDAPVVMLSFGFHP